MRHPNSPAISFLSASEDDLPSLIRIHMAAFANDNSVRTMFKSNDHYETALRDMLLTQLADPKFAIIMATTQEDTGSILGWQACRFFSEDDALESEGAGAGIAEIVGEKEEQGDGRTLRSVLEENAVRVEKDWMARRKYIHFDTRTYIRSPNFLA